MKDSLVSIPNFEFIDQKPDFLSYQADLKQADDFFASNEDDKAEHYYAEALKIVQNKSYAEKQVACLIGLAKICIKREEYTKSVALYNAVLVRSKIEDHSEIKTFIKAAEIAFLKSIEVEGPATNDKLNIQHQDRLCKLRLQCQSEIEKLNKWWAEEKLKYKEEGRLIDDHDLWYRRSTEVKKIYDYIDKEYKSFIRDLIEGECLTILGSAPCKYSIVALGSLASCIATPYSDFEFAILLEEGQDNKENTKYFRNFTNLLHIIILNLGQTILPSMAIQSINNFDVRGGDWFVDDITKRGVAFDGLMPGACKWPLGNMHTKEVNKYELIQTPTKLASFQNDNKYKDNPHLLQAITNICYIAGTSTLVDDYYKAINNVQTRLNIESMITILLDSDSKNYRLELFSFAQSGELLNVKKNIYRIPDRILVALGAYFAVKREVEIQPQDIWSLINDLPFEIGAKQNLCIALSIAIEIRLNTYLRNDAQIEDLMIQAPIPYLSSSQVEPYIATASVLKRFYFTAIPLAELIQLHLSRKFDIATTDFYTNNYFIAAAIDYRLSNKQKTCDELILFLEQKDINKESRYLVILNLGTVLAELGKHQKSLDYLLDLVKETEICNLANLYLTIAHNYQGLTNYEAALNNYNLAFENAQYASIENKFTVYHALAQFYYQRSSLAEATKYKNMCATLLDGNEISQKSIDSYYSLRQLLEPSHTETAYYYEHTKSIDRRFATQPTLDRLIRSAKTAQFYLNLGQYAEFKKHMEIAMFIADKIKNDISPLYLKQLEINYAISIEKIGDLSGATDAFSKIKAVGIEEEINLLINKAVVLTSTTQFSQALEFLQQAERIYQDDPSKLKDPRLVANIYHNFIELLQKTNQIKEAGEYCRKAYSIFKKLYGSGDNIDCALLQNQYGRLYKELKQYDKAINAHDRALKIFVNLNQKIEIAKTYVFLSCNYLGLNNMDHAHEVLEKAITLYESFEKYGAALDVINYALALSNLAIVHLSKTKNYMEAQSFLNKAEGLYIRFIKVKNVDLSYIKYYQGMCCLETHDYEEAHNHFSQALAMSRELNGCKDFISDVEGKISRCIVESSLACLSNPTPDNINAFKNFTEKAYMNSKMRAKVSKDNVSNTATSDEVTAGPHTAAVIAERRNVATRSPTTKK